MPSVFQDQIEGYVRFVDDVADELFADHRQRPPTDDQRERFLTLATVWRIWQSVDTQYWLLSNSLELLRAAGVDEVSVGSGRYSSRSTTFETLASLRSALLDLLGDLELQDLPAIHRVGDLVERSLDTAS